ncbi:MAG TPA: T9SS type A sorting domain-containing protein, partial [Chryseolinea sp.]
IGTGIPISAGISSATDVDWFKIEIPGNSNASLTILLGDIYGNLPSEYDLYVYNKNLVLIGSSATTATEAVTVNARGKNLRFYIKVVSENGTYVPQCYPLVAEISESSRPTVSASAPINEVHEEKSKALLYPNPASEFVYLNFNSPKEGLINIQIVNSIGQLVKQIPVNAINGHNQFKIQVADIRPGMYILRIKKGDLILTRKFVIAR